MATLYVENVPRELYEALRKRARKRRHSIAAEVLGVLEENLPTEKEIKARQGFLQIHSLGTTAADPFAAMLTSSPAEDRPHR